MRMMAAYRQIDYADVQYEVMFSARAQHRWLFLVYQMFFFYLIIDCFNARACTFRNQVFLSQGGHYECRRWKDDKELLLVHNPFAALPYIIDSENVVATAAASSSYLAHKLGLTGNNESERSRNQQALAVVYELRDDAMRVLYGPTEVYAQGHRGHLERTVRAHYYKLNSWLEKHGTPYLASDAPGDCAGSFFCPSCEALLLT